MFVGKSLLSEELSNRLNIPYITLDDLIMFVQYETKGWLSPNSNNNFFKSACISEIKEDANTAYLLSDEKYREKELSLIQDLMDLYEHYHAILGDFKPFYPYVYRLTKDQKILKKPKENIAYIQKVCNLFVEKIFETATTPIILDMPGYYGWEMQDKDLSIMSKIRLKNTSLSVKANQNNKETKELLNKTTTIFLSPGFDYETRTPTDACSELILMLNDLSRYYKYADIEITTNGVFNTPNNPILKQRMWLDAHETMIKEKLKNSGTISEIADEILLRIQELESVKDI